MARFSGWRSFTTRALDHMHCMLHWVARRPLESEQTQSIQDMSSLCMIIRALQIKTVGHDCESVHTWLGDCHIISYMAVTWWEYRCRRTACESE